MKLSVARSELLDSLSIVSKGMSSRSTLPILSGVLFDVSDGLLTLQSTDLEISVRHSCPVLAEQTGRTVIPGKLLSDIVRSLPEAAVTLETEGERVLVHCQNSSFTVKTLNPSEFPKFPEVVEAESVKLPASVLGAMVKKVARAVSRDETRAVLTGILLSISDDEVKMVATDSYRLAVAEKTLEAGTGFTGEVIIPGKPLDEVVRLAPAGESITIGLSENQVLFETGSTTLVTRRIEGSFPNYKQLIPAESETNVFVSTEELIAAVKRVSLLALHNTPLRVSVNIEDQTLSLSATTQDVGDASEDLMVKAEGKDVEIAFNHTFLMDGLTSMSSELTKVEIQSSLKPGLLRSADGDDHLYLLMPVRLG